MWKCQPKGRKLILLWPLLLSAREQNFNVMQPLLPPLLLLLSQEPDLTITSESWGLWSHPCQQKWKLHALPTFSCYPFLDQISNVCVYMCVCMCVCWGGHQGVRAQITWWIIATKDFGNLNSDFPLRKKGLLVCRYPQIWKKLLKVDGNCESDRCPQ